MAFRGRGRGRGGYSASRYVKPVAFVPFPDIPALGKATDIKENKFMAVWMSKFERFCKSSAYYIDDANECVKKNLGTEIERFSTRDSGKIRSKAQLSDFINMDPTYVPEELCDDKDKRGKKKRITDDKEKRGIKKVKWDAGSDLEDLLSKKFEEEDQSNKAGEKKKEEDDEPEDVTDEESSQSSSNGDYEQNIDFDDDEDDFNMPDDNDNDEPVY